MKKKKTKRSRLTDELLDIIDNASECTRSDLQGVIEAFVARNCDLTDDMSFIERLEKHKADHVRYFI